MKTWATTQYIYIYIGHRPEWSSISMHVIHGKRGCNREKLSLKGRKSNWATTHAHVRLKI